MAALDAEIFDPATGMQVGAWSTTMINADDLENWTRGQNGLQSRGGDWVSFHRNMGGDTEKDGVLYSNNGTSEVVMRNQFRAWAKFMTASMDAEVAA